MIVLERKIANLPITIKSFSIYKDHGFLLRIYKNNIMASEQHFLFLYTPWTNNNEDGLMGVLVEYIIAPDQESAVRKFVQINYENEEIRIFLCNYINTPATRFNKNIRREFAVFDLDVDVDDIQKRIIKHIDTIVEVLNDTEDEYFSIKDLPSPVYAVSIVKSVRRR